MSKEIGGSAFPRPAAWSPNGQSVSAVREGMSLRDYFAAQALPALINEPVAGNASTAANICHDAGEFQDTVEALMAFAAYRIADAMLAERAK